MVRVVLGTFSCNTGDGGCGSIESQNMVVNGDVVVGTFNHKTQIMVVRLITTNLERIVC